MVFRSLIALTATFVAIAGSLVAAGDKTPAQIAALEFWNGLHDTEMLAKQHKLESQSPKQWKDEIKQHGPKKPGKGRCKFDIGLHSTNVTTGSIVTHEGTSLYVTGPKKAKAGLMVFTDIFGPNSGRTKLDADRMGKVGYAVVVVDATNGDYLDPLTYNDFIYPWLAEHTFEGLVSTNIANAIAYLKTVAKVERIASYGYCWGGWLGAKVSTTTPPGTAGHVSYHPSWLVENIYLGDGGVDLLAKNVKVPQLLLSGSNDPDFVKPGGSVDLILSARPDVGPLSDVVEYPDMLHGWVNNGDLNDPNIVEGVNDAFEAGCEFLQKVCPV